MDAHFVHGKGNVKEVGSSRQHPVGVNVADFDASLKKSMFKDKKKGLYKPFLVKARMKIQIPISYHRFIPLQIDNNVAHIVIG